VTERPDVEGPDLTAERTGLYVDAGGNPTDDPRTAVQGEILGRDEESVPKRTWFLLDEVQIKWLPMSESAFLLWVLLALVVVWVGIAVVLGLL
jgi:hypothetical protein